MNDPIDHYIIEQPVWAYDGCRSPKDCLIGCFTISNSCEPEYAIDLYDYGYMYYALIYSFIFIAICFARVSYILIKKTHIKKIKKIIYYMLTLLLILPIDLLIFYVIARLKSIADEDLFIANNFRLLKLLGISIYVSTYIFIAQSFIATIYYIYYNIEKRFR